MLCCGCGCAGTSCWELSPMCKWATTPGLSWYDPPPSRETRKVPWYFWALWAAAGAAEQKGHLGKAGGRTWCGPAFSCCDHCLSSLRILSQHGCPPASLGSFVMEEDFLSIVGRFFSISLQCLVYVFNHLPVGHGNLKCGAHVSTHVGKFLLNFEAVCFPLRQFSLELHYMFLMQIRQNLKFQLKLSNLTSQLWIFTLQRCFLSLETYLFYIFIHLLFFSQLSGYLLMFLFRILQGDVEVSIINDSLQITF